MEGLLATCESGFTAWLRNWQELIGACAGGLLGVIGALIVAASATNRERRNASRMLQRDLLNVTGMIYGLTYRRTATLETVGGETLARNMQFYRYELSPMFETEMAVIIGTDTRLAGLLIGFHQSYTAVQNYLRVISEDVREAERARRGLPRTLKFADDYAQAALHLLPFQELGVVRRVMKRLRHRLWPTAEELVARELVTRMSGQAQELDGGD